MTPGQVDWDEPGGSIHRGVNVGEQDYEEITVFFLDLRTQCRSRLRTAGRTAPAHSSTITSKPP